MPSDWIVTSVYGGGGFDLYHYVDHYKFGSTAHVLPNPVVFYYDVTIPAGTTGDQILRAAYWDTGPYEYEFVSEDIILREPRTVSGVVFHEEQEDGYYNEGTDAGVAEITVRLLEGGGTNVVGVTETDSGGAYSFGMLPDGDFDLEFWVNLESLTIAPGGSDTNRNQLAKGESRIVPISITEAGNTHVNVGLTGGGALSSGADLRAYRGSDGVYVEFAAYDVEDGDCFTLYLIGDDGESAVWSGDAHLKEGAKRFARFKVPGLEQGSRYNFALMDEVGKIWWALGVEVKPFAMDMVSMTPKGMRLSFATLPGRLYEIQWAPELGADWRSVHEIEATGEKTATTVIVPESETNSGFFRIILKE